jgi:hypothetical protein
MFYAPKGFVFEEKKQQVLKEGGAAAESLIPQLDPDGTKELKFKPIPKSKLEDLFNKVENLLTDLKGKGFIEDVKPSYMLGSTRLAAYGRTKDKSLLKPGETEEVLDAALDKKTLFGDLDIDVEFVSFSEEDQNTILNHINSLEGVAAKKGANQFHLAVVDGKDVYQVDLVNVKDKRNLYNFKEKSSFIDLSKGIKGAFSIFLLRSLASTKDTDRAAEKVFRDQKTLADKGDANASKIVKAASLNRIPTAVRYSLSDKGLVLKLVLEDDPKNPPKKSRKPAEFLILSEPAKYGYENLDELAKYLLDDKSATGNDIYHAILLANKFKNLSNKKEIWDYFLKSAEINLKKGISKEDYELGIKELEKIIFKENNQDKTIAEGRKGIGRFSGASQFTGPKAFNAIKEIAKSSKIEGNKLIIDFNKDNLFLVEKMDSSFCHFGLDKKGQFFFESSGSGQVYSKTADKKFGFSPDFLKTFKDLENNKSFQNSLKTIFNEFGSFKFSAEFFPVLTHKGTKDGQVIFVGVPYSEEKLGTKGAFVIFNINLLTDQGNYQTPDYYLDNKITSAFKILSQKDGWSKEWRVYTNNEDMKKTSEPLEVDLQPELANALLQGEYSRGLRDAVVEAGQQIQDFLDNKANTFTSNLSTKDDSFIEGLVLKVLDDNGDILEVKGTSSLFDERKKEYWQDRTKILELQKSFEKELLEGVLKFTTSDPGKLNKEILKLGQNFDIDNSDNNTPLKQQFYFYILKNLTELGEEIKDPKEIKARAIKIIDFFSKEYSKSLEEFKKNQKNLDQDSIRKTNEFFKSLKDKIQRIEDKANNGLDDDYLFNLTNSIIGFRIDNRANFDPGERTENNRENVIIWNGRAQPWHYGHHAMIEKGIANLEETNSKKVLIFLVKGSAGTTTENPLTFDQQVKLLNSIYKDNPKVEVAQEPLMGSFSFAPINALHELNYNLSGWLAGPDRIGDYKKNLIGFNIDSYLQDHDFSPVSKNERGLLNLTFIPTERKFRGTESRIIALEEPFENWLAEVTKGMNLSSSAKQAYKIAYDEINKIFKNSVENLSFEDWLLKNFFKKEEIKKLLPEIKTRYEKIYNKLRGNSSDSGNLNEPERTPEGNGQPPSSESSLDEVSGVGAVVGFAATIDRKDESHTIYREMQENYFIKREDLMEELKLRKAIRKIVTENKRKQLNEEQRLRKAIRGILTEAKQSDEVVYESTGVNALRDLLGNIGSIIKDKYRNLTTSPTQREAFKNHLLIGWRNLLNVADISKSVQGSKAPKNLKDIELEEDVEIKIKKQDPSNVLKDFSPEDYEPLKSKEQKLVAGGEIPTDPDQLTGMNIAAETLNLISTQTLTAYEQLLNPKDAEDFKEFGLANIAAYLDEIEAEMTGAPEVEIEDPVGSVEVEEPEPEAEVEDQLDLDLSEDLLHKLASLL